VGENKGGGNNTAVVSVKVSKDIKAKMREMKDIEWSTLLRKTIEAKIKEHEKAQAIEGFLAFRASVKLPKNKTEHTSETLLRETREER
jgi:hypothetical protein